MVIQSIQRGHNTQAKPVALRSVWQMSSPSHAQRPRILSVVNRSVTARAATAPAAHTLHLLILLQLLSRHTADTRRVEIRLLRLNTAQAAKLLVALLLPLGDQVPICVAVLQQPVVELLGYRFFLVVQIVDVLRACEEISVVSM